MHLDTKRRNSEEMVEKNRQAVGNRNARARLTEEKVYAIRSAAHQGMDIADLSRLFEVGRWTIRCVVERKTWKHLPERDERPLTTEQEEKKQRIEEKRSRRVRLTEHDVRIIRSAAERGVPVAVIARVLDIGRWNIRCVVERKTWKHIP
jgi:hypothetical protein